MKMTLNIALLSLLIPAVLAIPKYPHQARSAAGIPTGGSYGTGAPSAPYGQPNSTVVGPTGTGVTSISVVTVVPIPGSTQLVSEEIVVTTDVSNASNVKPSNVPRPQPPADNEDAESPEAAFQTPGSCGPATITVTEANTVTVTVGAAPANSSPASPPKNVEVPAEPVAENTPAVLSDVQSPTSTPKPGQKHGHNHSKFHHKSSVVHAVKSDSPVAPGPAAPTTSTQVVPAAAESTREEAPSTPKPDVKPEDNQVQSSPQENTEPTHTPAPVVSSPPASRPVVEEEPKPEPSLEPEVKQPEFEAPEQKEPEVNEPKVKEPEVKESEVKEPEVKEPEVKEPESKVSTPSSPGTKRGLVYNTAALTESFSSSPVISWCYNWDSQPGGHIPSNFNFVPMMWGPLPVHTGRWKSNADKAIAAGATHLLGFNEPDLPAQANLTPEQAAEAWREYLEPYAGKVKLGSPAVCNGGGTMGLNWLARFMETCSGCTIDFIAIHWYGLASDDGVGHFKEHVGKAVQAAQGRPVWITEFQPNGSPEEQARWLEQVLPWLDDQAQSGVERYSYFQVDNILVSGNSLTELGAMYAA